MMKSILAVILLSASFAATNVYAQEVYWKKQNVDLQVTGAGSVSSVNTVLNRIVITHNYYECGYYEEPQVIERTGTCYEVKCSGGAGRSEAWDAFYSARKAEKPSKLAAAIKGVGKASAEALVAGNYFSSKPRSWDSFKSEITAAANSGAITQQVKTMVLSTYRADNMANLGYAAGSCTSVPYSCQEVVIVQEGYYVPRTCDDSRETVIDTKVLNVTMDVKGAVLLPSEVDKVSVTLSGAISEISVSQGIYNNYSAHVAEVNGNSILLEIDGAGRRQVKMPENALQSVSLIPGGSHVTLQVGVAPFALPVVPTEKSIVEYTVKTCAVGFFGSCGIGWDKTESFYGELTQATSLFDAPIKIAKGRNGIRMEVDVKIYKQNSIYHDARPVSRTTEKITIK